MYQPQKEKDDVWAKLSKLEFLCFYIKAAQKRQTINLHNNIETMSSRLELYPSPRLYFLSIHPELIRL